MTEYVGNYIRDRPEGDFPEVKYSPLGRLFTGKKLLWIQGLCIMGGGILAIQSGGIVCLLVSLHTKSITSSRLVTSQ